MADNPLSISIPQPAIAFLDPTGNVSRPWLYYLLTLLNRTGGTQGISTAELQKEINAILAELVSIEVLISEADIPMAELPENPVPISIDSLFPVDAEPPAINPILAALLVSDVA